MASRARHSLVDGRQGRSEQYSRRSPKMPSPEDNSGQGRSRKSKGQGSGGKGNNSGLALARVSEKGKAASRRSKTSATAKADVHMSFDPIAFVDRLSTVLGGLKQ